jgi:hypothetical protein
LPQNFCYKFLATKFLPQNFCHKINTSLFLPQETMFSSSVSVLHVGM